MELQELNARELAEINGGLLGFGNSDSQNSGTLIGNLGINFSQESMDDDGDYKKTDFGLNLDLGGMFKSLTD